MKIRGAFALSLKETRLAKELTQEHFDTISSRTYISMLERSERSPTLDKIDDLASALNVHPLTLLTLSYMKVHGHKNPRTLHDIVLKELASVLQPKRT